MLITLIVFDLLYCEVLKRLFSNLFSQDEYYNVDLDGHTDPSEFYFQSLCDWYILTIDFWYKCFPSRKNCRFFSQISGIFCLNSINRYTQNSILLYFSEFSKSNMELPDNLSHIFFQILINNKKVWQTIYYFSNNIWENWTDKWENLLDIIVFWQTFCPV